MSNLVRRVTLIERTADGVTATTLYKQKNKKRRVSRWARPLERSQRKALRAADAYVGELLGRHERSNDKRRDGWMKDGPKNHLRAIRKAYKKL